MALLFISAPVVADNGEFRAADFLQLPDAHKKFWIYGSIDTMAQLAAANDNSKGQCIADWYYKANEAQRNGFIVAAMQKYRDKRPTAVMVALLESQCGKFRKTG